MKDLINMLLIKDEKARPRVIEIIQQPFVKEHMTRFVTSQGKNNLNPQLGKKRQVEQAIKMNKLKQQDINTLSNQDKIKLMKEKKYQQEFELKCQAAKENAVQNVGAK